MNVTRRGLLGLAALGAGSLALSACESGEKGTQAGNVTTQAPLAPGDGYSKDDSGRSTTYQTKGHKLLAGLGSFETICQPRGAQGRVEQLTYQTHSYVWEKANPGQEFLVSKVINVWLPADYDASRTYDVLYLMHGTGHEGAAYWLTDEEDCHGTQTRGLLDGMVEDGLIKDVIVACPSYYSFPAGEEPADVLAYHQADSHADDWPRLFWK